MEPLDQSHVRIDFLDKGQSSKSLQFCDDDDDADADGEKLGVENGNGNGCSVLENKFEVDLEAGVVDDLDNKKESGDECGICRICHFSYDSTIQELGGPMELGCSCKGDLATAHKQCAEAWFKIRGHKTCEICGLTASNVTCVSAVISAQQLPQEEATIRVAQYHAATAVLPPAMSSNFWQDRRLLNILLAVMVFAFVISWLFHFKAPNTD